MTHELGKQSKLPMKGFRFFLRYPENMDFNLHESAFPLLAVITHELSKVIPNGLPEPDYNDGLLQFDCDICAVFENEGNSKTVLIETFGGKRKYYIYIGPKVHIEEAVASVSERYPHEQLSWSIHPDAEWNFIKRYAEEFLGD